MPSRSTYIAVSAMLGGAVLLATLVLLQLFAGRLSPGTALIVAISSLILSLAFMHWLGSRFDAMWRQGPPAAPAAAALVRKIVQKINIWTPIVVGLVVIAYVAAVLLFLPPGQLEYPLQPILTFLLSGIWFAYILYALSRLITAEGHKAEDLAAFALRSVAGALALSIYFLIPFDWLAASSYRAFETLVYGAPSGREFNYASTNSTVNWLQSTAIPSIISIAFGFLVAYITSLVWYDYYRSVYGAGLITVEASRRGRDPARNDLWFGRLKEAKNRAILCGATLGGWFKDWEEFRSSLHELFARESVHEILIVLPDPRSAFFWQRRSDEKGRETLLWEDPITRLARAIEMLYLALPNDAEGDLSIPDFFQRNRLGNESRRLAEYINWFQTELAERVQTYAENSNNESFSALVGPLLKESWRQAQQLGNYPENTRAIIGKIGFMFVPGTMMGVSIFDDQIYYTPYLPRVEDKDCPQFTLASNSQLGTSVEQSIEAMKREGVWIFTRSHALAFAFRFWAACRENPVSLKSLADVPAWLTVDEHELTRTGPA